MSRVCILCWRILSLPVNIVIGKVADLVSVRGMFRRYVLATLLTLIWHMFRYRIICWWRVQSLFVDKFDRCCRAVLKEYVFEVRLSMKLFRIHICLCVWNRCWGRVCFANEEYRPVHGYSDRCSYIIKVYVWGLLLKAFGIHISLLMILEYMLRKSMLCWWRVGGQVVDMVRDVGVLVSKGV